ncbi:sugar phosphate isomerase/epimerase family protein [Candidatus Latescibacterota bacterium]
MQRKLSRRKALAAGTAATGALLGANNSPPHAKTLPQSFGRDFLMPWNPGEYTPPALKAGATPVRLSCSAHCIHYSEGMDIPMTVKAVRDNGYTACEASDAWKQATDSEIRELHDALRQHDVMFYTIHVCINNIHPDMAERRKINKRVAENVETAERLGLGFIVTHTGSCAERATRPHRDNWSKEAWDASVKAIRQIIRDTSGSNVDLAIEALNPCNINTPWAHVKLREDVGDSRVKVTLDPQNMINLNTYYRMTELVNVCFYLLGEDVCYAHCKDVKLKDTMLPSFEWVVAGTGTQDFATYLLRLSHMKKPRPFFLEFLKKEQYPAAKKHIMETAEKVGVKIYW